MMGIEIIPNWHPIFVHFTVALLSISALFYLAGLVLKNPNLLVVARWNLWIGASITVGTVLAGFYAYNTVAHDGPSHAAMTDHKNWALVTASTFGFLAIWAFFKHRGSKSVHPVFVILMLLASILLGVTGFKGGEVVYRYGLGVMSLPEVHEDGGHGSHSHGEENEHEEHGNSVDTEQREEIQNHDHGDHAH